MSSRNFANKIRNAARFVGMNLDGYVPGEPNPTTSADKWIFTRLAQLVENIDAAFEEFEFGEITRQLYSFFWNEFCDWYIEFSKSRLNKDADPQDRLDCQRNLVFVLDQAIRLLHPIMPFVTEEIYQELPGEKQAKHLIVASWPQAAVLKQYCDEDAAAAIGMVCDAVSAIRSTRARYGISPKSALDVFIKAKESTDLLEQQASLISSLANVSSLIISADAEKPAGSSVSLAGSLEVYVALSGLVDFEAERARLQSERDKVSKDAAKLEKKLSNQGFLAKAAPEIIEKDRAHFAELTDKLARIDEQLAALA